MPESYSLYYDICASLKAKVDEKYYLMSVYTYGATFLRELNKLIGDKAFFASLQEIYTTYIFKQADTEGILNIFRNNTSKNIEDLITRYFKSK